MSDSQKKKTGFESFDDDSKFYGNIFSTGVFNPELFQRRTNSSDLRRPNLVGGFPLHLLFGPNPQEMIRGGLSDMTSLEAAAYRILEQAQDRQTAGGPVFDPDMPDFMRRFLEHAAKTSIIPGFSNVPGYEEEFKKMQEALKKKDQPKEEKKKANDRGAGCSHH
ncbi:hypothetical protein CRE_03021 [Caenorhabditis remanei]|uniref:Uncharacterized protein n=1 Tax=Caenorhabditis remanei TaxID=31234 RepID=E3LW57_CAERE|nr:hypothetical protein CRE_03021 [Caenorhabditis remanei]